MSSAGEIWGLYPSKSFPAVHIVLSVYDFLKSSLAVGIHDGVYRSITLAFSLSKAGSSGLHARQWFLERSILSVWHCCFRGLWAKQGERVFCRFFFCGIGHKLFPIYWREACSFSGFSPQPLHIPHSFEAGFFQRTDCFG